MRDWLGMIFQSFYVESIVFEVIFPPHDLNADCEKYQ